MKFSSLFRFMMRHLLTTKDVYSSTSNGVEIGKKGKNGKHRRAGTVEAIHLYNMLYSCYWQIKLRATETSIIYFIYTTRSA